MSRINEKKKVLKFEYLDLQSFWVYGPQDLVLPE